MSNAVQIVENSETSEFYPTPREIAEKMLSGIKWEYIKTILEPSAGKGDILRVVAQKSNIYKSKSNIDVDCIEIDANLRQILKYNFSDKREKEINHINNELNDRRKYDYNKHDYVYQSESDRMTYLANQIELKTFFENGIHIVHDDFLTYEPYKQYDLIIMNPPFSNGDKHLLKALDIQKKGGSIVCLLNAETIRNPYTETRRELKKQLDRYGAQIEYMQNAFVSAERRTGVEIALIKVSIEAVQEDSDIYERFKKAEQMSDDISMSTDLEVTDYIKAAVTRFNVEVKSGIELIRQYRAMIPYMSMAFSDDKYDKEPILRLTDSNDRGYDSVSVNDYLKAVRLKYWRAILSNPKFVGKLTSKLQEEYRGRVEKLSAYDFSEFNIYTLSAEMNAQIKSGIEDEIMKMFDKLPDEHTFYPECAKNRHYFDGWTTNQAHKIGGKVIIPCYGIYDSWDGRPRIYNAKSALEDIEKILNFFDGGMTRDVDLWNQLDTAFKRGETKNIELRYFKATFYKKGTIHLVFTAPELIERFNIYAAQQKAWLPPTYGKKRYKDMSAKEKAVVDSFQGEQAYNKVLDNAKYYLASPVAKSGALMIESGT